MLPSLLLALAATGYAAPRATKPPIHPRPSWGALEEVAGRSIPSLYAKDGRPRRITLHHTDIEVPKAQRELAKDWLSLSPDRRTAALKISREQAAEHVRDVQALHLRRGWNDIGYHFLVDWMGRIYAGRPIGVLGAHTEEANRGNIGIALLGDLGGSGPSVPQQVALERLIRWLAREHRIRPEMIRGHRDYRDTDCPGDANYPLVARARQAVKRRGAVPPERAVGALLEPWRPGRPSFAGTVLAQRVFDSLLPH